MNDDSQNIYKKYEEVYGRNNPIEVNKVIEEMKKEKTSIDEPAGYRKKVRRGGRGNKNKGKNHNDQYNQNDINSKNIEEQTTQFMDKKPIVNNQKENNIMSKSKFDQMFSKVYGEQFEADDIEMDVELGTEGEGELDLEGGDDGGDEVLISLPLDMANKLCELIMAATGGTEEELTDELGEGEFEDEFGGDIGGDVDGFEEGMGEDSLSTAPDGVSKFTSKKFTVGANGTIGDQKHAGGRGALSCAPGKVTPKPHPPQGK